MIHALSNVSEHASARVVAILDCHEIAPIKISMSRRCYFALRDEV